MSEPTTVNPALSAGALLRLAREQQGMHIAMLAAQIKVPVKKVQALEADQFEEFASAVFVRSLAASVCRTLKVDAAPVLALLPQPDNLMLSKPTRIQEPSAVRFRPSTGTRSSPSRTTMAVVGGLALVTLLVAFVPDLSSKFTTTSTPDPVAVEGVATENVAPALGNPVQVPEVAPPTTPASADVVTSPPAAAPVLPSAATTASATPASSATPAASSESAASTPASSGVLGLTARGDSWVQVLDAQGHILLSRVVLKGEKLSLDGALPLKVVVGRVDQTEVSVRGKPYSMADVAQSNVARFEVK